MEIIPAIDLMDGKTVRLKQGRYRCKLSYDIAPVDAARRWVSMGAKRLHIVDLDGAKAGRPVNSGLIGKIVKAAKVPVEVGGGFRKNVDIQKALDKGVFRVVVGSKAFQDLGFAGKCVKKFGYKIIFSADLKGSLPSVQGWEKTIDADLFIILKRFCDFGVKEIIYTNIERDGMFSGPDIGGLKQILTKTGLKVILAGGIKTIGHIRQLKKLEKAGLSGVIVGRALYEGTLDLKEAVSVGEADNTMS